MPPTLPQSERLSGVAAAADSAPRKNAPARPLSVTDDAGVTVTLDKPATRIIALYGAYNELLLALDARAVLVARTVADARLPALAELADLPVIGTHMRPNAELIVAAKAGSGAPALRPQRGATPERGPAHTGRQCPDL